MEEQVIIELKIDDNDVAARLAEVTKEMEDVKSSQKELRDTMKEGGEAGAAAAKEYAKNTEELRKLKAEQSALTGQLAATEAANRKVGTSMKEMSAQLAAMKSSYQSLTEEQRQQPFGQTLLHDIEALDKAMKEADATIGNFQRNVGDYENSVRKALDPKKYEAFKTGLEGVGFSTDSLTKKFKALAGNPWMVVIGILIKALVTLRDKLKESSTATASLNKAAGALKPVMEALGKVVDFVANLFSHALDWAIQGVIASIGWLGKAIHNIGKVFGKDWGGQLIEVADQMKKNSQATEEVTEKTEELGNTMATATKAVKDYNDAVAQTNEDLSRLKETIEGMPDMKKAMGLDRNDNLIEQWRKQMKDAEEAAKKAAEDAKVIQWHMEQIFGKQGALSDDFMERLERESNPLYNFSQSFKENAKDIESVSSSLQSSFGSLSSIYKQISEDETKSEEERAKAARAARRWALAQVAANSAVALSKSIAEAASAGPWPANMAAIASSVATVLAMIAQAKALLNEGGGSGTTSTASFTSYGGGSQAAVNGNGNQQMQSVADAQHNGTYVSQLAQIVGGMPAPVLVYSELRNFEDNVISMNESQIIH